MGEGREEHSGETVNSFSTKSTTAPHLLSRVEHETYADSIHVTYIIRYAKCAYYFIACRHPARESIDMLIIPGLQNIHRDR